MDYEPESQVDMRVYFGWLLTEGFAIGFVFHPFWNSRPMLISAISITLGIACWYLAHKIYQFMFPGKSLWSFEGFKEDQEGLQKALGILNYLPPQDQHKSLLFITLMLLGFLAVMLLGAYLANSLMNLF